MTDARLRVLYALVLDRRRARAVGRISVRRLLALVERRGPEADRLATLDRVMRDRDRIVELDVLRVAADVSRP